MKKGVLFLAGLTLLFGCRKEETFNYQPLSSVKVTNESRGFEAFVRPAEPDKEMPGALALDASAAAASTEASASAIEEDASWTPTVPPPSIDEVRVGPLVYTDRFFSVSEAIRAGIPIVNTSGSRNIKLFVKDYGRKISRQAKDGITTLYYGQVIRSVIEIAQYGGSVGLDLASIAAHGTLSKSAQNFYLYKDGFYHPDIDIIIASVSGKVFDVENYSKYQEAMKRMIELLSDPETQMSVNLVERISKSHDDSILINAPIIAFTLARVAAGDSCDKIRMKFMADNNALEAVSWTYRALSLDCDGAAPSSDNKKKAKEYLQGVNIK